VAAMERVTTHGVDRETGTAVAAVHAVLRVAGTGRATAHGAVRVAATAVPAVQDVERVTAIDPVTAHAVALEASTVLVAEAVPAMTSRSSYVKVRAVAALPD
jgi:hypothetical protein